VRVTDAALVPPLFATVIAYDTLDPGSAWEGPLFVTATSACEVTVVMTEDVLFAMFGSAVELVTLAVLVIVAPGAAVIRKPNVKVAVAPAANDPIEQLIVPVAPTAGVMQVNAGPAVCDSEANVVPAGTPSVRTTAFTALAPPLVTMTV
jgi:hypothetical protein